MITLGINAAFHDTAAALVVDGVTVAAADRRFDSTHELAAAAARLLAADRILGWFHPGMQARLNQLKDREDFRPVAPAVTHEQFDPRFHAVLEAFYSAPLDALAIGSFIVEKTP